MEGIAMPHTDEQARHEEHSNSARFKARQTRESLYILAIEIIGGAIVLAIMFRWTP
jgi:hypothetical protein